MGNRTFFKNVTQDKMSFKDIFSDVTRKHTSEETARVFIAGTELTTPREEEMLAGWQKPFLFARAFLVCAVCVVISLVMLIGLGQGYGAHYLILFLSSMVSISLLLLVWEMHIPRSISLMEIFKIVCIGGLLSLTFNLVIRIALGDPDAMWAGLVEEPAKLAVIWILLKRKNRKYILDGILLGAAVGAGFSIFESFSFSMNAFGTSGMLGGVLQALVRATTAIAGHEIYAALYGGGLMIAKGSEEVKLGHLLSPDFLKYFVLSIGIHAVNNSGMLDAFPSLFFGTVPVGYLLLGVAALYFLLLLMKKGVNQVVQISVAANGGRVTYAVNRGAGLPMMDIPAQTSITLEGISGPYMGRKYQVGAGRSMTIGRAAGKNGIALEACKNVSSVHCQVKAAVGKLSIKDLGSTNGTYIGGQKLVPHQESFAGDGAIIYLGDKNCGFRVRV